MAIMAWVLKPMTRAKPKPLDQAVVDAQLNEWVAQLEAIGYPTADVQVASYCYRWMTRRFKSDGVTWEGLAKKHTRDSKPGRGKR